MNNFAPPRLIHTDARLLGMLCMLVTLLAITGGVILWDAADRLLRDDAQAMGLRWAKYIDGRALTIDDFLGDRPVHTNGVSVFQTAIDVGTLFRYQVFATDGTVLTRSDAPPARSDAVHDSDGPSVETKAALSKGETVVVLKDGKVGTDDPGFYSDAYIPIFKAGALTGFVEVSTDLSAKARHYRQQIAFAVCSVLVLFVVAGGVPGFFVWRKMVERRRVETDMRYLALYDVLTELPNRTSFSDRLEQSLVMADRSGESFAVMCIDLDYFKEVNDTFGHFGGDVVLREVGQRLHACVRDVDSVARLGGDEFAIIQVGLQQPSDADILARRALEAMEQPLDIDGQTFTPSGSIGIAVYPVDGSQSIDLLKNADLALYRAKAEGRGTHRFFEPQMDALLKRRRALEIDLRQAVAREQLELHYQPLLDVETQRVKGFEALIRWVHPERGMICPDDFIPIAEQSRLIVPIGAWILRRACLEAATWSPELTVAINLSPVQFRQDDFAEIVDQIVADTGIDPQRLELEVTETVLLEDTQSTLATLRKLKDLGVRIVMDDFGTGYASLSYLQRFSFDKIKIDRSFISAIEGQYDAAAIVRAVIGLGQSLGIATTAEGVETEVQLAYLKSQGCDEAQGHYFCRPIRASEILAFLEGHELSRKESTDHSLHWQAAQRAAPRAREDAQR